MFGKIRQLEWTCAVGKTSAYNLALLQKKSKRKGLWIKKSIKDYDVEITGTEDNYYISLTDLAKIKNPKEPKDVFSEQ